MHFYLQFHDIVIFAPMETFNEKIKRIRKSRGLNQTDICSKIGITQPSFASIEAGRTKSVSIDLGKKIALALDVDFNELFDIQDATNSESHTGEIELLKKRILVLEEQLNDKRRIVEFLSKNNLLLAVASQLYHDENPDRIRKRNFNDPDSLLNEINEMPYDPGDPESQYLYILKCFDELKKSKKE